MSDDEVQQAWQEYLDCEHDWVKVETEAVDMPEGFGAVFRCTNCECLRLDRVRH